MNTTRTPIHAVQEFVLRLYVAGNSPNSLKARNNLHNWVSANADKNIKTEIVDVLTHRELALEDGVLLTPALVRLHPPPMLRIIGDLSNTTLVSELLVITS